MWTAKIKFSTEGTLIGSKAVKYNLDFFGFPISYNYEKNWVIVQLAGNVIGSQENITRFLKEAKKEKRVVNLEINNNFVIAEIKEPLYTNDLYQKDIFHVSPALISSKGFEIVEIGSFSRDKLIRVIELLEKNLHAKVLSISNKKIKTISLAKISPDLTDKQKSAMTLAIKNGYYEVPRKISVEQLAKLSGLSFSTFQVHLRKAENKLMPFYFS
jgi:predicted DNA binding protein